SGTCFQRRLGEIRMIPATGSTSPAQPIPIPTIRLFGASARMECACSATNRVTCTGSVFVGVERRIVLNSFPRESTKPSLMPVPPISMPSANLGMGLWNLVIPAQAGIHRVCLEVLQNHANQSKRSRHHDQP